MIEVFTGEFLVSPVPLELSFNYCSHKCAYCFANLGVPDRRVDIAAVMRMISSFHQRKTFAAWLMQEGYPICVSNKVDPLAVSNDHQALPAIAMLTEMEVPVQIQTKGGRKEGELRKIVQRPSVWYVSISFLDDTLRKKLEPGATTIESRLELIQALIEDGHQVILGMNPLVPEWLPEPEALMERFAKIGGRYAWIEGLHLHSDQERQLTSKEREAITEPVIARSKLRHWMPEERDHLDRAHAAAKRLGIETFTIGFWHRTDFHRAYRDCYPQTFPTMQDYVNDCWDELGDESALVGYESFTDLFLPRLPDRIDSLCHYLRAGNYAVVDKYQKIPNRLNFAGVLKRGWMWPELTWSPARQRCFAMAIEQQEETWSPLVDDEGMPWYVWCPHGTENRYMDATHLLEAV